MFRFIALCWRDLWRNTRRSVLVGLIMVLAVVVMVLMIGVGDGAHSQMIHSATDSYLGHIRVMDTAAVDEPGMDHLLSATAVRQITSKINGMQGIKGWASRLETGGLITKKVPDPKDPDDLAAWRGMVSEGAMLAGMDPAREKTVSVLAASVVPDDPHARCLRGCKAGLAQVYADDDAACERLCEPVKDTFSGRACANTAALACKDRCKPDDDLCDPDACSKKIIDYCVPAHFLGTKDPFKDNPYKDEVVLGAGLADVLNVDVGDTVAFTTAGTEGRTFGSLYRVAGLLKTGSLRLNRSFALTRLKKLTKGLHCAGQASAIIVSLDDIRDSGSMAAAIGARLKNLPGISVLPWEKLAPELEVFVKIDQGGLLIMLVLFVIVIGVILANVVTMSVMERTREYGIRIAIGESPTRIAWGLIVEILILAILTSLIGSAIGEALNLHFQTVGISLGKGDIQTTGVVISSTYYSMVTLYGFLFSICTIIVFSLLGAVLPAWKIRHIDPIEALRFI